ncbi:septal ring lytic transglycosylase RlpA family protein [Methylophilaceae bacterium]|nr:septal ring lytic transglycosylase RlpA family protein [Methylophilaceae bacterium]
MTRLFTFLIFSFLSGCASLSTDRPDPTSKDGGYYSDDGPGKEIPKNLDLIKDAEPKIEKVAKRANMPYKVFGEKYVPMREIEPYKEIGYASWYGKKYHGNKTSVGEVYDMYGMTAAHKTLPIPCYVKVTNLVNNKTVIVRVNDRGPFIKNRLIDLSYAAAYRLDIIEKGSERVLVELIDPSSETVQDKDSRKFYIQAGAFSEESNAEAIIKKLDTLVYQQNIESKIMQRSSLFSVLIGPYLSKEEAENASSFIAAETNLNTYIIKD